MRFLADVNVSRAIVAHLRTAGFDVVRVPECVDPRATDIEIIEAALRLGTVMITHDQDFTTLLAIRRMHLPSLINLRTSSVDAAHLASRIVHVVHAAQEDLLKGAIVTVDDRRSRVHLLPID